MSQEANGQVDPLDAVAAATGSAAPLARTLWPFLAAQPSRQRAGWLALQDGFCCPFVCP